MTSGYRTDFDRFWAVLKENRPIAFAVHLARITGHPKAAVLLSQLTYWTRHGRDVAQNDGWIFKTREQWWLETGLSRDELESARARLRELKLIQEWRGGRPARLWYRLDIENLARRLNELHQSILPQNLSFDFMRAEEATMRKALGPTVAYHRVLAEVTGGINAGLVLSRLIMLQRRALDSGAGTWISITARDWQADLALNRRQLENAKHKLCQLGLITEQLSQALRKRLYTQVLPDRLFDLLQPVVLRAAAPLNTPTPGESAALRARLFAAAEHVPATNVRFAPTGGLLSDLTIETNVRKHPTGFSHTEIPVGGKRTLVDGGKGALQSVENVHGSWRETYIANARVGLTTSLNTSPTTTGSTRTLPAPPSLSPVGVGLSKTLIWPTFVRRAEQLAIGRYLAEVPHEVQQEFLDEMAANHRRNPVNNPGGYVRRLCERYRAGTFVAEQAHTERTRREQAQRARIATAQPAEPEARSNPVVARAALAESLAMLKRPRPE